MKRLFLIALSIMTLTACSDNDDDILKKEHWTAKYTNDVDKELVLTLYVQTHTQYIERFTIPANGELTLSSDANTIDSFILIDSLHGTWAGEREFWLKGEDAKVFKQNWADNRIYDQKYYFNYSFTFTRKMYDAAKPIEK